MSHSISFGTSGWRAPREEFTDDRLKALSKSINTVFSDKRRIVVGYDTREKSEWIAQRLSRYLSREFDLKVADRPTPTPCIAWYASENDEVDLAVSVTASHNPPEYNGIKVIEGNGADATKSQTQKIESKAVESMDEKLVLTSENKRIETEDFITPYVQELVEIFRDRVHGKHNVLYDAVNGTGSGVLDLLIKKVGCEVSTRNNSYTEGLQGIEPNPSKVSAEWMENKISSGDADIGFISDCDADRIKIVTSEGKVGGSELLACLYDYLSNRTTSRNAVRTVGAGSLIDRVVESKDGEVFESPIGFKHTSRMAEKENAVIGGDQTDGYCYPEHLLNKDGLYTALIVLEMIDDESIMDRLNRIKEHHGIRKSSRSSVKCPNDVKEEVMDQIDQRGLPSFDTPSQKNKIDGFKFYYGDKWILIRPSGTEPKMRIYAESNSSQKTEELIERAENIVQTITEQLSEN